MFNTGSVGHVVVGIASGILTPELVSLKQNLIVSLVIHTIAEFPKKKEDVKNFVGDTLSFLLGFYIGVCISPVLSSMMVPSYRVPLKLSISLTMILFSINEYIRSKYQLNQMDKFFRHCLPLFLMMILIYLSYSS